MNIKILQSHFEMIFKVPEDILTMEELDMIAQAVDKDSAYDLLDGGDYVIDLDKVDGETLSWMVLKFPQLNEKITG